MSFFAGWGTMARMVSLTQLHPFPLARDGLLSPLELSFPLWRRAA